MSAQIFVTLFLLQVWLITQICGDDLSNTYTEYDLSTHPCKRKCVDNGKPMDCYYKFEVSQYSTMSRACFGCPNNITDCFDPQCLPADGLKKAVVVVNKQLPGPMIEVCKGDRIIVDLKNTMPAESTSVHWHGILQRGTPFMDGVPHVTQCPISPGQTFRYNFLAANAGTNFWHSHTFEQRAEGMFGGLIVREPVNNDLYDVDEHVLILNEWTERPTSETYVLEYWNEVFPEPYNILINGLGPFPPTNTTTPRTVIKVEKGKRYRMRIISSTSHDCPMLVKFDNHEMIAFSSDGNDFKPVRADTIRILSGERYDVVIEANQDVDNYWIRVKGVDGDCETINLHQVAILRYNGAPEINPKSVITYENPSITEGKQINRLNTVMNTSLSIGTFKSLAPDDEAVTREPNHQFYIVYDSYRINKEKYLMNQLRRERFQDLPGFSLQTIFQLNNINFEIPPFPLLTQFDMIDQTSLCNSSTVGDCFTKYCRCPHVLQVEFKSVVELVIVDEGFVNVNHPMHLHGYKVRVVAMGRLEEEASAEKIKQLDKEGKIERQLTGAPIKDTVTVPSNGYTIVRFYADNPGFWLFHCHIERHAHLGMELVIKVGEAKDTPAIPKDFPRC
ncbi:laccase-like precursor [Nasonia vitripennis]|uniref:Uncharacterized protein n=1 Tax=Nasonia vitripennis TaxID=7425 RepID=A0A7M6UVG1_NASVI|nr:laccase-like precursor [Nasonia vitripennis]